MFDLQHCMKPTGCCIVVYAHNSGTGAVKREEMEGQSHPQLHSETECSLAGSHFWQGGTEEKLLVLE